MAERSEAAAGGLRVSLVTPKGPVIDEETDAVTAPGQLGEFEVFPGHVPLLTQLHPGVLVLGDKEDRRVYAVSTGVLEVGPDGAIQILVERAVEASRVDLDAARAEVAEFGPQLKDWKGAVDAEWANLKAQVDWAQAQVDAASR
jgi:F-type H+-transporting ATPase subunit epsilon